MYIGKYFAILATVFASVATILTAMQVVTGISSAPALLISVSYHFLLAVLVGILVYFGYIGLVFVTMYSYHFFVAKAQAQR